MLTIGITIRRLNHSEYPVFKKMNQNGRMIKTAINNIVIIRGGMSLIICMENLLKMVCHSHLTNNYLAKKSAYHAE